MPQLERWKKDGRSDRVWRHKKHSNIKVMVREQPHGYTVILSPTNPAMFQPQILTNTRTKRAAFDFARDWMKKHGEPHEMIRTRRET